MISTRLYLMQGGAVCQKQRFLVSVQSLKISCDMDDILLTLTEYNHFSSMPKLKIALRIRRR